MYGQNTRETSVIKKRTFILPLSDAEVTRLYKLCGKAGLSPEELLASFVGDLVCGIHTNGSDEREYALGWFERCGFEYTAEKNLRYLLNLGEEEAVIECCQELQDLKDELRDELLDEASLEEIHLEIKQKSEWLQQIWTEYLRVSRNPTDLTLEDSMTKLLDWYSHLQQYLEESI